MRAFVLTRALDYDQSIDVTPGINTYVLTGTTNGDTTWALTTAPPIVVGTGAGGSNLTYSESAFNLSLPVSVANGGTGQQSFTVSQLLYGNGTNALSSVATSSLAVGTGLTVSSGSLGAQVGGSNASINIDFTHANSWTGLQTFANATSTLLSSTYASSTAAFLGSLNLVNLTGTQCLQEISGLVSGTGTACGSGGGTGLATTSPVSGGNLLEYSSAGAGSAFGIATTSATINNGLTGTLTTVNNTSQTIGLATINAGVLGSPASGVVPTSQATSTLYGVGTGGQILGWANGGLTALATTTFNSPLTYASGAVSCASCLTANQSITLSGVVTGSGATAITTAFGNAGNGVLANPASGAAVPSFVATSTLKIALSDTTGTLTVLRGGTGVTSFGSNQLLYGGTSGTAVAGVGTTSPTVGLGLTFTNLVTLTSAAGATTLNIATSSLYTGTVGQNLYFSGTNALTATSSLFVATSQNIGISTTAPNANLTVSATASATPMFWIGVQGSSTPAFVVDSPTHNGNVGIATTTPFARLAIGVSTVLQEWMFRIGNVFGITSGGAIKLAEDRPATSTAMVLDWTKEPAIITLDMGTANYTVTFINATTSDWAGSRKMIQTCAPSGGTPEHTYVRRRRGCFRNYLQHYGQSLR